MKTLRPMMLVASVGALALAVATGARPGTPPTTETTPAGTAAPTTDDDRSAARRLSSPQAAFTVPRQWKPTPPDPPAARDASLEQRASRRAYLGAPPVMPHSRNYAKSMSCLDCHAEGIRIGTKYGPKMSHPVLASCQQCHVEGKNLDFPPRPDAPDAVFTGPREPQGGARAWPGAPPVVPHNLLMRTDCLSCHGVNGYPGLRTSHPDRLNCVQCHGVAATLDQTSPFFTGNASGVIPVSVPVEASSDAVAR
ncbi:MAG: hypothetical protein HKO59_13595 [Phycisphaerales bacterium]|nr:nitrate reductase cytochrome c-type subunit [Phycisphaerae bacterium]NNF43660.1 hypothetical protein [Phycisphaerales bacterium]NNM26996.1 hypothetical protein [Phycisphaerales bacterium]